MENLLGEIVLPQFVALMDFEQRFNFIQNFLHNLPESLIKSENRQLWSTVTMTVTIICFYLTVSLGLVVGGVVII